MIREINKEEILRMTSGRWIGKNASGRVSKIIIDSRKIVEGENVLFIAIKGLKNNGHRFIPEVYQAGVRGFVIAESEFDPQIPLACPDAWFIVVTDTLQALQAISACLRSYMENPVIGITGSNGKTIVKEWLGHLLGNLYHVAKSPKSFNSQIGVPLSILGIEPYHQIAILEAGISKRGEMQLLENMIQPTLGIFTNLGTAHQEGFQNNQEKLIEKLKLFSRSKFIIYRKDQSLVSRIIESCFPPERLISWSDRPGADYVLVVKTKNNNSKILVLKQDLGLYTFETGFSDQASLENLRHVIVASLSMGVSPKDIEAGLKTLKSVEMRLTLKQGIGNCMLIDDTYNNDLGGLEVALEFMDNQRPKSRKLVILSEMFQGGDGKKLYQQVGKLLIHHRIDCLYAVGKAMKDHRDLLPKTVYFFEDTQELISFLTMSEDFENDLILIKGARKYQFEKIVDLLQERIHGTTLEINLNNLSHNYLFFKNRLAKTTKIMVMVKAFAYGGGAVEISNYLQHLNADYLAVAYTDEGVSLRSQGIGMPIMVLNPIRESFPLLSKYQLEPVVYSVSSMRQLGEYCSEHALSLNVHLDLDTGMRRLGFEKEDLPTIKSLLDQFGQHLFIASIYTHLAGADEAVHEEFSLGQLKAFQILAKEIQSWLNYLPLRHALNSAGIIRFPDYQMDMVRLGIGLYGLEVNGQFESDLKPVSALKTTVSQIKSIQKGHTVGYGRRGVMPQNGRVATLAIGYADGFDRRFSNGIGQVVIHNQKAPVIGNVCMDMCMVDVSHIEEVKEGDEVILYGEGIPLKDLANSIGTIPYELLTNISSRVKRVYFVD